MSQPFAPPVGLELGRLLDAEFVIGSVGIIAGVYAIFALGLQLNVGYTGIINFGQSGFMAVGAYAMGILTIKAGFSFWLAMPAAVLIAMAFGLLVGLPSVRLRADYLAIATIAAAEIVNIFARNARGLTGGNQGLACNQDGACFDDAWLSIERSVLDWLEGLGWQDPSRLLPLFAAVWLTAALLALVLTRLQRTPWGRVLRAVRDDEDAARAVGKNTYAYKLQSLALGSGIAAVAGFFLALNINTLSPVDYEPLFTFLGYGVLVLGGLASYWGVLAGAALLWFVIEGTRQVDLPFSPEQQASLRYVVAGLILMALMAWRPQGLFGKREEMVLRD